VIGDREILAENGKILLNSWQQNLGAIQIFIMGKLIEIRKQWSISRWFAPQRSLLLLHRFQLTPELRLFCFGSQNADAPCMWHEPQPLPKGKLEPSL